MKFKNTLIVGIRNIVYYLLSSFDTLFKRKNTLTIFCYHSIANDDWRFGVSLSEFKKQINYLLESGYAPITLEDVEEVIRGRKQLNTPSFVINFDDGYKDILQTKEFLQKRNIFPTLFLLSEPKSGNRKELGTEREFLSTSDLALLKKFGWGFGNHSATHSEFYSLTKSELKKEIVDSKKTLEKKIGRTMKYFAYPRGRYTNESLSLVKKSGYTLGLSMDDGLVDQNADYLRVARVGVDRSHTFQTFKATFSPSVILLRGFIKSKIGVIV